jgi:Cys-tRNA(Pro)/Cys-tRNA(Cys) deacylase
MELLEALAAAGIEVVVHRHPPIRREADLHLTGLDWTAAVKTLAFALPGDGLALVGVPGPWRVRYGAIAQALGVSRSQLRPAPAERLAAQGMEPGGITPLCDDPAVVVLLDASVPAMGRVFCGGGTAETTLEVAAADIARFAARPVVAVIADPPT